MTPPDFFNKISKYYDFLTRFYMLGSYEAVRRRIVGLHQKDGQEVLDICCGTGYISNHIAAERVVGIDLSMPMLQANQHNQKRNGKGAFLINGSIRNLPFHDSQFKEVYFTLAAHEFPDLSDVLEEVRRVMQPDGRLIIYDLYEPPNRLLKLFLYTFYYYIVEQKCMWIYTRDGWNDLLESTGFRMQSLDSPYGLSALVSAVN